MIRATIILLVLAPSVRADVPPDYGYQWATIGDPGNRPTQPAEVPDRPELQIGSVGYEYRMAKTEVTVRQWYEFVQAYAPFYSGPDFNPAFTGSGIQRIGNGYAITVLDADQPTGMSWEYAARFCNWLCNGKAATAAAFTNGAYDTSTFSQNPDGTGNYQLAHTAGAAFWIPSLDEWVKGAYWDPNKGGEGIGGYWRHPGGSDEPLVPGAPQLGGQTNAGRPTNGINGPLTAGSYPDVNAPWGLLDTSGGVSEWLESTSSPDINRFRHIHGSSARSAGYAHIDQIETTSEGLVTLGTSGLRIASVVPAPSASFSAALLLSLTAQIRRRR